MPLLDAKPRLALKNILFPTDFSQPSREALPFALAVFWERLIGRVGDSQSFEQESTVAVVGEITHLPTRSSVNRESVNGRIGYEIVRHHTRRDGSARHVGQGLVHAVEMMSIGPNVQIAFEPVDTP